MTKGVNEIQRLDSNADDIDVDEAGELEHDTNPIYDKIYNAAEKFAGTRIGQYATGKLDSFLKLIEDTAKWSLPPKYHKKNETIIPLERPLPWVPFIALILMIRLVRIGLSIAGLFIGNDPLLPSDVVYFFQTRRRKLRSIRIAGMKEMRKKYQAQEYTSKSGLISSLTSILSMALCRPKLSEDVHNIPFTEAHCSGVKEFQQNHKASKYFCNLEDSISDHDLTLNEILDKYGGSSNEDDDSDFIPPSRAVLEAADNSTTTSATSDDDTTIEGELEDNVNRNEKAKLNNDSSLMSNGNSSIEIHEIKVNGEHLETKFKKPKKMPKPLEEIKQEPVDSEEDTNTNQIVANMPEKVTISNETDPTTQQPQKSNCIESDKQEQSIFEHENDNKGLKINENGIDVHSDVTNGEAYQNISNSEIFVTPATSAEDLFFSPVGSPDLCGAYGFQPTSILKNYQTGKTENSGYKEDLAEVEDFLRGEISSTSRAARNPNYSGKSNKNKFRGKRR